MQADLARRLRAEGWTLDAIAEHMKTRPWSKHQLAADGGENESDEEPS